MQRGLGMRCALHAQDPHQIVLHLNLDFRRTDFDGVLRRPPEACQQQHRNRKE